MVHTSIAHGPWNQANQMCATVSLSFFLRYFTGTRERVTHTDGLLLVTRTTASEQANGLV